MAGAVVPHTHVLNPPMPAAAGYMQVIAMQEQQGISIIDDQQEQQQQEGGKAAAKSKQAPGAAPSYEPPDWAGVPEG